MGNNKLLPSGSAFRCAVEKKALPQFDVLFLHRLELVLCYRMHQLFMLQP